MVKVVRNFLYLLLIGGLSISLASYLSPPQNSSLQETATAKKKFPANLSLEALRVSARQTQKKLKQKPDRAPALARVIDPASGAKFFAYGACYGPYGERYNRYSKDYAPCMNNELATRQGHGPMGGKVMGFGFILSP